MNSFSSKYLCRKSNDTGNIEIDFNLFWDYIDMVYFSPIFHYTAALNAEHEKGNSIASPGRKSAKCLSSKLILIDQENELTTPRKRQRLEDDGSSVLKKRGQNTLSKAELMSRLKVVKERNAKLSKTYFPLLNTRALKKMQKDEQRAKRNLANGQILNYTLKTIAQLEWYQLAESAIAITGKRKQSESPSRTKDEKEFEYMVEFDKTTGLKPLWLDYDSFKRLSKMREELLPQFSPDWGTVKIVRPQPLRGIGLSRHTARSRKSKSIARNRPLPKIEKKSSWSPSRSQKSITKLNLKPVKQLWSLLDESTMGRRINFDTHNLCHHCKRVLPMTLLSACKYNSQKNGLIVPNCIAVNNTSLYNSNSLFTFS